MARVDSIVMTDMHKEEHSVPTEGIKFDGMYGIVTVRNGKYLLTGIVTDEDMPKQIIQLTYLQRLESFGNGNFIINREIRYSFGDGSRNYQPECTIGHLKIVDGKEILHQRMDEIHLRTDKKTWHLGHKDPRSEHISNKIYIPVNGGIIQIHNNGWCLYDVTIGQVISPRCHSPLMFVNSPIYERNVALGQEELGDRETMTMFLDEKGEFVGPVYSTYHRRGLPIRDLSEYREYCNKVETSLSRIKGIHNEAINDLGMRVLGKRIN